MDQAYYDPKEINALFQEDNIVISPTLKEKVQAGDNTLKDMIVEYVGNDAQPENGEVTVEMVVQTMSRDFPEFLLAVAEENWIRGYHQALYDSDLGKKLSDPAIPETLNTFAESLSISDEQKMNLGNSITKTVSGNLLRKVKESDFTQKIMSDNNKPNNVPNLLPFNKLSEKMSELDINEIFESVLNKVTPQSTTDQSNDVFNIQLNAPNVDKLETLGLIP